MIDYSLILCTNYSRKSWSVGETYDSIVWLDSSPKPTKEELDSLFDASKIISDKKNCKTTAKSLLAASDWSVLTDVELTNSAEFIAYRAALRELVINPVVNPTFPNEPQAIW